MMFTKEQFDGIFGAFSDNEFVSELNKEARELFKIAEQSESFKSTVGQWIQQALSSLTLGGVTPKPVAMIVLVSFLLGMKHSQALHPQAALPELPIPITEEEMEALRREIRGEK